MGTNGGDAFRGFPLREPNPYLRKVSQDSEKNTETSEQSGRPVRLHTKKICKYIKNTQFVTDFFPEVCMEKKKS